MKGVGRRKWQNRVGGGIEGGRREIEVMRWDREVM